MSDKQKICFYLRTSTDDQDYSRQKDDLIKYFAPSHEILEVERFKDKMSGFKKEDERLGLRDLKDYCLEHQIKNVAVWELSRLSRKPRYLMELCEDFFEANGINIYFYQQGFWLLDSDGKQCNNARLQIALFGHFAETEALTMKDRVKSGKARNKRLKKYNGGIISLGYTLDDNNFLVPDTKEYKLFPMPPVDLVKWAFQEYAKDKTSLVGLCKEAQKMGFPINFLTKARMSFVLHNDLYCGRQGYPAIVSEELFEQVQSLMKLKNKTADKSSKNIFLLRGLIKCKYCGANFSANAARNTYVCNKVQLAASNSIVNPCQSVYIGANQLESVIWDIVKSHAVLKKIDFFDRSHVEATISARENRINIITDLLDVEDKKRRKVNNKYDLDQLSDDEYRTEINRIINNSKQLENEKISLENEIEMLLKSEEERQTLRARVEELDGITDRLMMKKIINYFVDKIEVLNSSKNHLKVVLINFKLIGPLSYIALINTKTKNSEYRYLLSMEQYLYWDDYRKLFWCLDFDDNTQSDGVTAIPYSHLYKLLSLSEELIPIEDGQCIIKERGLTVNDNTRVIPIDYDFLYANSAAKYYKNLNGFKRQAQSKKKTKSQD